ncbi:hypothetical protein X777_01273 [Ooceraea biroi]|uniref:Uncharacterized protein n=1 Tax=Ooceraea biroi TaxID=2015173 RepID=A0A026WRJ7_OOCBI|nr:hypothetical protein X777_01273 [Ooceraea biroi]
MAKFGCAPHYIRLAAFLSAVNPSVSCSGSWYLNVTLEPPTNLQQLRVIFVFIVVVVVIIIITTPSVPAATTSSATSTSQDRRRPGNLINFLRRI